MADGDPLSSTDIAATGPAAGDLVTRINALKLSTMGVRDANGDGTYYAILAGTFNGDNQSVAVIPAQSLTPDAMTQDPTLFTAVYMHSDTAGTVGTFMRIFVDHIDVGTYTRVGSTYTYTVFPDGTWTAPKRFGESSRLEFRNNGTEFVVLMDGVTLLTVTGTAVTFGTTRRTRAVSIRRSTIGKAGKQDSFWLYSIITSDYLPQSYLGSGAKMARLNSTVPVDSGGGINVFPAYFFDTVIRSTTDITCDPATCKYTVSVEGWYEAKLAFVTGAAAGGDGFAPCLFKNGARYELSGGLQPNAPAFAPVAANWAIYLLPGEYVQPGALGINGSGFVGLGAIPSFYGVGDAIGSRAYFSLTLANRSIN